MDPLDRADALLSRAQSRGAYVVTPQSAVSPMDAANTQQIPRAVVRGAEAAAVDPDATTILTDDEIREQDEDYLDESTPTTTLSLALEQEQDDDEPEEPSVVEEEEVDGLLPTTTQRMRSTKFRRLEG